MFKVRHSSGTVISPMENWVKYPPFFTARAEYFNTKTVYKGLFLSSRAPPVLPGASRVSSGHSSSSLYKSATRENEPSILDDQRYREVPLSALHFFCRSFFSARFSSALFSFSSPGTLSRCWLLVAGKCWKL